jgi:hypothetical protein
MRIFGTLPVFVVTLLICAGMFITGIQGAAAPAGGASVDRGTGFVLIFLAVALGRVAFRARAQAIYDKKMQGMADWARGLGPDRNDRGQRK